MWEREGGEGREDYKKKIIILITQYKR